MVLVDRDKNSLKVGPLGCRYSLSKSLSEKSRTTIVRRAAEILDIGKGDDVVLYLNDKNEVVLKKG